MPTSIVDICNMALSHVRAADRVSTVFPAPEDLEEARQCYIHYPNALQATLEAMDWDFARVEEDLALIGTAPARWAYQYQYPSDCLVPRAVTRSAHTEEALPFETAYDKTQSPQVRVIWTDQEDACLRYTALVEDPNLFNASFVTALAYRLASNLAMPLKGEPKLQQAMYEAFLRSTGAASRISTNTGQAYRRSTPRGSTATRARG